MLRFCLILSVFFTSATLSYGSGENKDSYLSLSYTGDVAGCIQGGIKTGFTYLGLFDFSAYFSTSSIGLWKGGSLLVNIQNTHAGMPSADLVGDVQVLDNIENGNHTYLFQLLYRQHIGNFWFLTGLHDMNSEFLASDYSSDFLNSSFGIMPVVSMNNPVSIFPRTSLALVAGYQAPGLTFKAGVYQGDPGSFDEDPYNLKTSLRNHGGSFSIFEVETGHNLINGMKGKLRAGFTYKTKHIGLNEEGTSVMKRNYTCYLMADQEITRETDSEQGMGIMAQVGFAPAVQNDYDLFYSFGLLYRGLFHKRNYDVAGLAVAHASASGNKLSEVPGAGGESVIELTYKLELSEYFSVQPCFQKIFNPGIYTGLKNATAIILRIEIKI